jgi:hypothetical protein
MHRTEHIYVLLKFYNFTSYTSILYVQFIMCLSVFLINTELPMLFIVMNVMNLTPQMARVCCIP